MQDIASIYQISRLIISKAGFNVIHAETIKCEFQSTNIYIKPCEYITYFIDNQNHIMRYDYINKVIVMGPYPILNKAYLLTVDPKYNIIYVFTPSRIICFTTEGQLLSMEYKPETFKLCDFGVINAKIQGQNLEFFDILAGLISVPIYSITKSNISKI
jgi:hypothetical protein